MLLKPHGSWGVSGAGAVTLATSARNASMNVYHLHMESSQGLHSWHERHSCLARFYLSTAGAGGCF